LSTKPELVHIAGKAASPLNRSNTSTYNYPQVASADFIVPGAADFNYSAASVAHTRGLTFIKKHLGGPIFDLEKIWDEHTYYEFEDRSVEKTMATMVDEPYVNHIPTMTGGVGRERLTNFYRHHFIFSNPEDTALELVSRTIGVDRIVDEFIFTLTHTAKVDWL
jgi:carboxymethylenebutenolidase